MSCLLTSVHNSQSAGLARQNATSLQGYRAQPAPVVGQTEGWILDQRTEVAKVHSMFTSVKVQIHDMDRSIGAR